VACFISTCSILVALYDLVKLVRWKKFHRDALSTSLLFAIMATLWTALLTGTATRYTMQSLAPDASGSKMDVSPLGRILSVFVFLFSTLSMMNVSLVWIEIAQNAEKMKRSQDNVNRYRRFLLAYYVVFIIVIVVAFALGQFTVAAIAALPGVLFVIVTYLIGFLKMRRMLSHYLMTSEVASSVDNSSSARGAILMTNRDAVRKMRQSLRAIEWAALGISFCALNFIVWMGMWVLLGGFIDVPNVELNLVALSLAWLFVALANAVAIHYLHGSIRRKVEALMVSGSASSSPPEGKNKEGEVVAAVQQSDHARTASYTEGSFKMHQLASNPQ